MSAHHSARASAVAALAILMSLFAAAPVAAADVAPGQAASVAAVAQSGDAQIANVQPDGDVFDPDQAKSGRSMQPLIGIAVMGAILVFGLRAIKRQRDEGRRSKLPPIG